MVYLCLVCPTESFCDAPCAVHERVVNFVGCPICECPPRGKLCRILLKREPPLVVITCGRPPFSYNEKLSTLAWQHFPVSRIKWHQDVIPWCYIWQSFVAWSLIYQDDHWMCQLFDSRENWDIYPPLISILLVSTSALPLYLPLNLMDVLNNQGRIQDSPQDEVPNLLFCPNFRKTSWNWEKSGPWEHMPKMPPSSDLLTPCPRRPGNFLWKINDSRSQKISL